MTNPRRAATSWTIHGQSVAAGGGSGLPRVCENPRKTGSSGVPLPPVASYPRPSKPGVAGSNPAGRAFLEWRGPLHPAKLIPLRSHFAARSAPFAFCSEFACIC
jgi:hypothetical protein